MSPDLARCLARHPSRARNGVSGQQLAKPDRLPDVAGSAPARDHRSRSRRFGKWPAERETAGPPIQSLGDPSRAGSLVKGAKSLSIALTRRRDTDKLRENLAGSSIVALPRLI